LDQVLERGPSGEFAGTNVCPNEIADDPCQVEHLAEAGYTACADEVERIMPFPVTPEI
jgi:hypothetical protein